MRKKVLSFEGSFTLEAAILLPIILFVIVALIYLSFYLHDTIIIQNKLDQATRKAENVVKHIAEYNSGSIDYARVNERTVLWPIIHSYEEEKQEIEVALTRELKSGLFITRVNDIDVNVDYSEVRLSVTSSIDIPFTLVRAFLSMNKQKNLSTLTVHRPAEFVRVFTIFSDTASGVKGADEVIKGLQKLIKEGE